VTQNSERFRSLGLSAFPVVLAPLAGVSDHPFRRVCAREGAELTYVEMLSATALLYQSKRTLEMARRHESETILGVQITGKSADEVGRAVAILDKLPFDTIDINMGCPVNKVVRSGCGSGFLKDVPRIRETVRLARAATAKPLSVKIRVGWDKNSVNALEVADAIQSEGADWLTVHGRLRSDDYGDAVDLPTLKAVKDFCRIPVLGNGNIFSRADAEHMRAFTGVDGVMVSRGALGNPWVFKEFKEFNDRAPAGAGGPTAAPSLDEWRRTVLDHLAWQSQEYGDRGNGAVCMRKHLLWYAKGWPGAKKLREQINTLDDLGTVPALIDEFVALAAAAGVTTRQSVVPHENETSQRFSAVGRFKHGAGDSAHEGATPESLTPHQAWDPKWDMDRRLDRGVGDEGLELQ